MVGCSDARRVYLYNIYMHFLLMQTIHIEMTKKVMLNYFQLMWFQNSKRWTKRFDHLKFWMSDSPFTLSLALRSVKHHFDYVIVLEFFPFKQNKNNFFFGRCLRLRFENIDHSLRFVHFSLYIIIYYNVLCMIVSVQCVYMHRVWYTLCHRTYLNCSFNNWITMECNDNVVAFILIFFILFWYYLFMTFFCLFFRIPKFWFSAFFCEKKTG